MIQIFAGYDPRESVGYHTFCQSVITHASRPVCITPLHLPHLEGVYKGGQRDGTNAFIYSRFLVPQLMGYKGAALFVDGCDMLCRGDIAELWDMFDPKCSIQIVPHAYRTQHPVKYVGTPMQAKNEDYPRKNWSSVMLMNCAHYDWQRLGNVAELPGSYLHRLGFTEERFVGTLPLEWNWLVDEYGPNENARLLHWSSGMPGFKSYHNAPCAEEWHRAHEMVNFAWEHPGNVVTD